MSTWVPHFRPHDKYDSQFLGQSSGLQLAGTGSACHHSPSDQFPSLLNDLEKLQLPPQPQSGSLDLPKNIRKCKLVHKENITLE